MDEELKVYLDGMKSVMLGMKSDMLDMKRELREHTDASLSELREHTDASLDQAKRELIAHTGASLDQAKRELREHTDASLDLAKRELREHTEVVETRLLGEFFKWARTSDLRYRQGHAVVGALDDRVQAAEDRIAELERRKAG